MGRGPPNQFSHQEPGHSLPAGANAFVGIAVHLLSALFLGHVAFPRARHHTRKFFSISYYNEATGRFALGWDDIFFVFYWIIVFTGMRCAVMDYVLTPIAAWAGIEKKKARIRFAEQAWILLYYGAFWSCGMVSSAPTTFTDLPRSHH
jgi:acyl-CoA-dependent ceramide synthase